MGAPADPMTARAVAAASAAAILGRAVGRGMGECPRVMVMASGTSSAERTREPRGRDATPSRPVQPRIRVGHFAPTVHL